MQQRWLWHMTSLGGKKLANLQDDNHFDRVSYLNLWGNDASMDIKPLYPSVTDKMIKEIVSRGDIMTLYYTMNEILQDLDEMDTANPMLRKRHYLQRIMVANYPLIDMYLVHYKIKDGEFTLYNYLYYLRLFPKFRKKIIELFHVKKNPYTNALVQYDGNGKELPAFLKTTHLGSVKNVLTLGRKITSIMDDIDLHTDPDSALGEYIRTIMNTLVGNVVNELGHFQPDENIFTSNRGHRLAKYIITNYIPEITQHQFGYIKYINNITHILYCLYVLGKCWDRPPDELYQDPVIFFAFGFANTPDARPHFEAIYHFTRLMRKMGSYPPFKSFTCSLLYDNISVVPKDILDTMPLTTLFMEDRFQFTV